MRLDVVDGPRINSGTPVRGFQQFCLRLRIGRGQRLRAPTMILGATQNYTVDLIAVALSGGKLLQHHQTNAFRAREPVGVSREGLATAVDTEHSRLVQADMSFRDQHRVYAANDGHLTATGLQCLHRAMHSDQRTRARRLDRLTWTMQVQEIAHAVGTNRRSHAGGSIAVDRGERCLLYTSRCV